MTLKDATTNSLLMFVAATCVVLIVRALPPTQQAQQAAASLSAPPGGAAVQKADGTPALALQDGVKVYYLHGNVRCPTCRSIEAYAQEAVETGFADELKSGQIQWQVVNYESPGNEHFATDYEVVAPNVVLVKFKGGKQVAWKGLPEVWEHVGDKAAFVSFVQKSLREFVGGPREALPVLPNPVRSPVEASPAESSPPPLPRPAPLPVPE